MDDLDVIYEKLDYDNRKMAAYIRPDLPEQRHCDVMDGNCISIGYLTLNPYAAEVYDNYVVEYLCDYHYRESCEDI